MASAMKLYSHALAPNPRRVRIFAAEKGIELAVQDIDILAGQSRTPEFLAKNRCVTPEYGRAGSRSAAFLLLAIP